MDLVAGVKTILVATTHCTKIGDHKLLRVCTLPLTGRGVVSRIYTDLATIAVGPNGFEVLQLAPGVDREYLRERTGAVLNFAPEHRMDPKRT